MVLRLLKAEIENFEKYMNHQARTTDDPLFLWENLYNFQKNWDIHATDFKLMFDTSVNNSKTKRFWEAPKKVMLGFIEHNPGFVKIMFNDLFDESKNLSGRIDRFQFYCENMLEELRSGIIKAPTDHLHTSEVIYFYLSMKYPEQYAVYHHQDFVHTLHKIEAKDIPVVYDVERFYKVAIIINKYLEENLNINPLIERLLKGSIYFKPHNLLKVTYFCWYCANHK